MDNAKWDKLFTKARDKNLSLDTAIRISYNLNSANCPKMREILEKHLPYDSQAREAIFSAWHDDIAWNSRRALVAVIKAMPSDCRSRLYLFSKLFGSK